LFTGILKIVGIWAASGASWRVPRQGRLPQGDQPCGVFMSKWDLVAMHNDGSAWLPPGRVSNTLGWSFLGAAERWGASPGILFRGKSYFSTQSALCWSRMLRQQSKAARQPAVDRNVSPLSFSFSFSWHLLQVNVLLGWFELTLNVCWVSCSIQLPTGWHFPLRALGAGHILWPWSHCSFFFTLPSQRNLLVVVITLWLNHKMEPSLLLIIIALLGSLFFFFLNSYQVF
jgi:hypothetical protein